MAFNPLTEKGIPLDKQVKNWDELNIRPYDKNEVHPYTRTRIILMNGIEIEHLHRAAELLEQYEGRDAESLLPSTFPTLVHFESNKQYVRDILAGQLDLTADGNMYRPVASLPDSHRCFAWQRPVNVDGSAPSHRAVEEHADRHGREYRLETDGPHPVEEYRIREAARA